jgi:hypothetical protein
MNQGIKANWWRITSCVGVPHCLTAALVRAGDTAYNLQDDNGTVGDDFFRTVQQSFAAKVGAARCPSVMVVVVMMVIIINIIIIVFRALNRADSHDDNDDMMTMTTPILMGLVGGRCRT